MFDMSTDVDGIADFLMCLSGLEISNSQMFRFLSEKIVLNSIKPQLNRIAEDNLKHSQILEDISKQIGNSKVKTKECKIKLSVICKNVTNLLKKVKGKKEITIEELAEYLEVLESSGGASQYLLVQAETFLYMTKEISKAYGMDSEKFNDYLKEIINDIEEHMLLLEEIKSIMENELTMDKKKHPSFKYQSPDAWFVPTHSQRTNHVN